MQELIPGIHEFRSQDFCPLQGLFEQLAKGQNPETLFITCSDSRIDPNLLTLPSRISTPRLGLCCQFMEQPISFRTTTGTSLLRLKPKDRHSKLSQLCLANAESLLAALRYCAAHDIGSFRIGSSILSTETHPQVGYSVSDLPETNTIIAELRTSP